MQIHRYRLQNGTEILFVLPRRARKHVILRVQAHRLLSISIPPSLGRRQLADWLYANEDILARYWQKAEAYPQTDTARLPPYVWLHGIRFSVTRHAGQQIVWNSADGILMLPEGAVDGILRELYRQLTERAQRELPERLHGWSRQLGLTPRSVALSRAKTFWGVCRPRTGIRLNWRLVGAPDWVADYVCIHELCHLKHANHSADFWRLVRSHAPQTDEAVRWLRQHGAELFAVSDVCT